MEHANITGGIIGGTLIGLSVHLLFILNGKLVGISGMIGKIISKNPPKEKYWCLAFLFGLILGTTMYSFYAGELNITLHKHGIILVIAGLLVGVGTRLCSGCTSGHGICGVARFSKRSIVATLLFITTAILTVAITKQIGI